MADSDDAYKDEVAPEKGSPYRPLYDDKIQFNGQPIALVLAEDWETATFRRFAGYGSSTSRKPHVTDLHAQRDKAFVVEKPEKPRGECRQGLRGGRRAPRGRVFHPDRTSQSDGVVRLDGDLGDDGKLTVYDKTQGVQNVQRYLCGVFGMQPDEVG